jgi:hypothetical protein
MRKPCWSFFYGSFIVWLLLLNPSCHGEERQVKSIGAKTEEVKQLLALLPSDSSWRPLLQHGMTGDGTRYFWMDRMHGEGVKLAKITVEFTWRNRGKQLSDWRVVSVHFCRDYECRESLSAHDVLANIKDTGLGQDLQKAAVARAKNGNWIEFPEKEQGTGYRLISLADNEWLPVNLPPSYGEYDAGTTPLMHAAFLGDVGRIDELISQGEDVTATTKDGTTALIYASTSDNPLALEHLLRAGAKVDASMKGGGNALSAAVVTNHKQNAELLLKAGADPNSKGPEGESVLSIAERQGFVEIERLLKSAGSHP